MTYVMFPPLLELDFHVSGFVTEYFTQQETDMLSFNSDYCKTHPQQLNLNLFSFLFPQYDGIILPGK